MRYHVIAMEDYVAKDERTVERCSQDVIECDIYIGIVARRYGFIPAEDEEGLSITEREYRTAREYRKCCLLFLLDPDVEWPDKFVDQDPVAIQKLALFRSKIENQSPAHFRTAAELVEKVMASVHLAEADIALAVLPFGLSAPEPETYNKTMYERYEQAFSCCEPPDSHKLYVDLFTYSSSGLSELESSLRYAKRVVWIDLGRGRNWWSTRLHLLCFLLSRYTRVEQIAFCCRDDEFVGMGTPNNVRQSLVECFPELSTLDIQPPRLDGSSDVQDHVVEASIDEYMARMDRTYGGELNLAKWLDPIDLYWKLGLEHFRLEATSYASTRELIKAVLSADHSIVPITNKHHLTYVIDRTTLAVHIALSSLS